MSTTTQIEPGFMGKLPQASQPQTVDALLRPPTVEPKLYDFVLTLPDDIMESASFTGTRADLTYAIKEPTVAQLREMLTRDAKPIDVVSDYVRAIGRPDEHGNPMLGEDGYPILMPVDHIRAAAWLARLGTLGFGLVTNEWTRTFMPTPDMGEKLRGSRRRV